jgi:hypothetical protein
MTLAAKGEPAFMAAVKTPVLLVASGITRSTRKLGAPVNPSASPETKSTIRVDRRAAALLFATAKVVPLEKTGRHPFPMITLGRAATNDVVLDLEGVSKLHATFVDDGSGNWSITDAGTTNGTLVQEKLLPPRATRPINDGEEIVFGNELTTLFFRPRALFGWARVNRVLFST